MIVRLRPGAAPELADADRFDRLHAESAVPVGETDPGSLVRPGTDDDHVWLVIAELRAAAVAASTVPDAAARFDAMIDVAAGQGWLDDDGTSVRAHVVDPEAS